MRVLGCLVIAAALFAVVDYLLWQRKVAAGNGSEEMQVSRVSIATLKNKKEEYYFDGTATVRCSHSELPMPVPGGWMTPCWYLSGHRSIETRY